MSSLGVVISGIAHEIRNPLQVIMAMSESIVDDDDLPRIQDDAQEIIDASHRISEIVNDLSTHARDARTLGRSTINLNDVADKAMAISKHTRNLKSVKIVKDYAKSPIVIGSTSELMQIITNFVNNGVDAMDAKGELRLATTSTKENHTISVTDNGSGMDKATQKKIFDPFFTTKDPGKGTGLGLHVVGKIVKKHGAKLDLKSELGKGTTFTVIFPHKKEA
jgi:signal transduction histidine kinase